MEIFCDKFYRAQGDIAVLLGTFGDGLAVNIQTASCEGVVTYTGRSGEVVDVCWPELACNLSPLWPRGEGTQRTASLMGAGEEVISISSRPCGGGTMRKAV